MFFANRNIDMSSNYLICTIQLEKLAIMDYTIIIVHVLE